MLYSGRLPFNDDTKPLHMAADGVQPFRGQQPDTERLIRRAFEQNVDTGITLLFQHYHQPLCSHAVRFVSSKEIAEDIVSDIFYEFHAGALYQTITTSFRAFLFTAVRNRAFDYVRAEMKRSTSLDQAAALPLNADQQPDTITQYEELYHDVEAAIQALPTKRRQVYVMHRFDGKKYGEIATELNLSVRTVEVHMYNAIHQLRSALKDKWFLLVLYLLAP